MPHLEQKKKEGHRNMQRSLWYKRIPTLFGLLLLGIGVFSVNFAINNGVFFTTRASPTYTPEEIRITNLTDTSFSVSYVTKDSVIGSLSYGTSPSGGKVALDDRDQQSGNPQPYTIHHITVKNLTPETQYYFSITSSDKTFLDKEKPFTTTTLQELNEQPTTQPPIVGNVAYADGHKDNNVIVLLVTDGAQTLSVLTKPDGTFVMPLNAIRTADFSSYQRFTPSSVIKLLAVSPVDKATVSVLTSQITPVPPITLGNSYDFTTSVSLSPVPIASGSANTDSFPSFNATEVGPAQPQILSPDKDEGLHDTQPQFEGKAVPNAQVQIEIHSDTPISTTVTANKNGTWSYRPTTKLAPGDHTITIKTKDSNGILKTITQSFTVYAEGSQFTEPSVSPNQPTPTPTEPVTSPSPTVTNTPTPTPSPTATATPTPIRVTGILTQSVAPVTTETGSSTVLFSGIIAALTVGTGLLLILLSKGSNL